MSCQVLVFNFLIKNSHSCLLFYIYLDHLADFFYRQLKHEEKRCMEELQCNIVVMKRSQPKVLRLNLVGSPKKQSEVACQLPSELDKASKNNPKKNDSLNSIRGPVVTPTSSPELGTPFTATEAGTSSVSSSDPGTSPFFISEMNGDLKKDDSLVIEENEDLDDTSSDTRSEERRVGKECQ